MTVWGYRVSPVFDAARTLLIAEIEADILVNSWHLGFDPNQPWELVRLLRTQQALTLICGAISEGPALLLEAAGLELIPFIAGDVGTVLEQYLQGRQFGVDFRMPGCAKKICCRGKIRRGRGLGAGPGPHHSGRERAGHLPMLKRITANDGSVDLPDRSGEMVAATDPAETKR